MADEENVRLLLCLDEQTIEALPDYKGPPEQDELLEYVLQTKHTNPSGTRHTAGNLVLVPKRLWDNEKYKELIIAQITETGVLGPGLGSKFDEVKHTFEADAMTCWTRDHNRDPGCSDYRSDKKLIKPDTAAMRKELGLPKYEATGAPKRWLCDFCPVHSLVQQAARAKAGQYK